MSVRRVLSLVPKGKVSRRLLQLWAYMITISLFQNFGNSLHMAHLSIVLWKFSKSLYIFFSLLPLEMSTLGLTLAVIWLAFSWWRDWSHLRTALLLALTANVQCRSPHPPHSQVSTFYRDPNVHCACGLGIPFTPSPWPAAMGNARFGLKWAPQKAGRRRERLGSIQCHSGTAEVNKS